MSLPAATSPAETSPGAPCARSPEDDLRAIWQKHRAGALARVDLIERAVTALTAGELDEQRRVDARSAAHSLIGSVGTFGFIGACEAARELELELADPAPARAHAMSMLIAAMRRELASEVLVLRGAQPIEPVSDRLRVLVVDDDLELCERIAAEARSREMLCDVAASPQDARVLCAAHAPAIVLLDLTFPPDGMTDAYALLSELGAATPPIPVLVLTGTGVFTDRVEAARRGSRAFLPKSMAPAQVLDAVEQFRARDRLQATRVLVVDDDPAVLDAMRALLAGHDLEVSTLADPFRFWETLQEVAPELLILDVDMPGINGPELCRTVRNDPRWNRLAVIFATARTDDATIAQVFNAGADDYIPKPIVGPELINRVANRLERIRLYRAQADTDYLTGLDNRAKASDGLAQLVALADRFSEALSVAMLDVDELKLVNDHHGHPVGDSVLRRLAEHLRRDFRGTDVVGRWGGEEFIVGMYGMTRQNGVKRLAGTLQRFGQEQFTGSQESFPASFSAGVAEYPLDGPDLASVSRVADQALYRAKASGRSQVLAASTNQVAVGAGS
ncbi:MAG TPA: response regulator [Solirubrobacteraceae bacterium]|nr:response regulator [Solirubrobacteraceae bacterium]